MSEWKVHLTFTDDRSNKFWRARIDDDTLYVNYGRIGSNGQTQVKELGSEEACEKELDKLARSKRRKGYVDHVEEGGGDGGGDESAEPAVAAVPEGPQQVDLALHDDKRKIDLRLSADGKTLRAVTLETFASAEAARAALESARAALVDEGYAEASHGDAL